MKYNYELEVRVRQVIKITVATSPTATASSENESGTKRNLAEIEIRGHFQFPRHDVKIFPRTVYSTTKTIAGGENRRYIEHFTKTFGLRDIQPIVVDMRGRSDIDVPLKWMKYPSAKRNEPVLPMIPAEEDDEEESKEEEEEEEEEEYDEFEEVIVVMNVRRNPVWRKGLEIPEPEPPKVGIPIEDLLEIPTEQAKQESVPGEVLIYEKIESVERPPFVPAELPNFGIIENL